MKKYTDVDIVAELQKLVDDHVDSYKEDFDIDKRIIRRAAESQNPEDKTLMWFCRPHGTHCLNENQVFIQGTRDHNTFRFYAEQTYDECIARVIIPKAVKRGKVFGDVFEINYREQAANVAQNAVAPDHDRLTFADGYVLDAPCRSSFDAAMALVGEHGGNADVSVACSSCQIASSAVSAYRCCYAASSKMISKNMLTQVLLR